jgi:deoxyribodipyrimidine photo-lyase
VHLYNSYNLDPKWRSEEPANRILLLEPSHFEAHPICKRSMDFVLSLARNIPGILVFSGEFVELKRELPGARFVSREHPLFAHWEGTKDAREWMFPEVTGWYPSFFAFWKKCERYLSR